MDKENRFIGEYPSALEPYVELIEYGPAGMFELDSGRVIYINKALLDKLGYSRDEVIGTLFERLLVKEDKGKFLAFLTRRGGRVSEPEAYRFRSKDGRIFLGEVRSRPVDGKGRIVGTVHGITAETRLRLLHRAALELGEVILAEEEIDRILELVLDAIVTHSGFARAVLSLYDLSIPNPFEGDIVKILSSGLSAKEKEELLAQGPMSVDERKLAFSERFRLGRAYYVPHDRSPWKTERGISGNVSLAGWHKDDILLIPLLGTAGIIGSISLDDPIDGSAPTPASIEPVAYLANFAALAVERIFKLHQLRKHKEQLHGLWGLGNELTEGSDIAALCDRAARRVRDDMDYDFCAIWLIEGEEMVQLGLAAKPLFPAHEIPMKGIRSSVDGEGITHLAIKHSEPVIVPDTTKDDRYDGSRASIKSAIAVPLIGRKGPIGVINVESQRRAAFGNQDLEALSALGSQLAITISALKREESLGLIYAFGQQIATASTVDQIVASTLDFLSEEFGYQLSVLFLRDESGNLEVAGERGPYVKKGVDVGWSLPVGVGIVGWVARNKRYAIVDDVENDPRYYEAFTETRSEIAVPILFSGELYGVLNIESRDPAFFDDDDRRLLEVIANHLAIALSNLASKESLREQAIRDPLTGLYNRHYFNSIIETEFNRSNRYNRPLTLMMIDIDGFRKVNNRLGHLKGDDVLQQVARVILESVRAADHVIRYGGDEFLVLMPETREEADRVAERLRKRVRELPEKAGIPDLPLDLSIGIYARLPGEERPLQMILEEVDRKMYADKREHGLDRTDEYSYPSPDDPG